MTDEKINLPAPITSDLLGRFKHTLFPGEYYRPLAVGDPLIEPGAANACVMALDKAMQPMTRSQAMGLAEKLMGYFPTTAINAGQEMQRRFVVGLVETFAEYPQPIGEKAVQWLKANIKFLNQSDLVSACAAQMRSLQIARGIAVSHLDEHRRREQIAQTPKPDEKTLDELAAAKERAREKGLSEGEKQRARIQSMDDSEFDQFLRDERKRMETEEPEYLERLDRAHEFVMRMTRARRRA